MIKSKSPVVISFGGTCVHSCYFCATKDNIKKMDAEAAAHLLKKEFAKGKRNLVIDGLGPEGTEDAIKIVAAADALGYKRIRIETTGIRLANASFLRRLIAAGINEICVFLPAADKKTFGMITRNPDGFDACLTGLANAAMSPDISVSIRIPVCAENHSSLKAILELSSEIGSQKAILDISETFPHWPETSKSDIMKSLRAATATGMRLGLSMSLKGHTIHQAAPFADGRIEKETEDFLLLTYFSPGRAARKELFSADLRLTRKCNQRCIFCTVNKECREPSKDELFAAIDKLRDSGVFRYCFEGGEPTLSPHLSALIERAASYNAREISIMTNGVAAADPALASKIVSAGANKIFISLHAHNEELSDSITRAPGTFGQTLKGIENFLALDTQVYIIFVMLSQNIDVIPQYVQFIHKNFGPLPLLLSMVTPYTSPALDPSLVPSYTSVALYVEKAAAIAKKLGVPITAMEEQHRPPDCAPQVVRSLVRNLFSPIDKTRSNTEGFIKNERCKTCAADTHCPGVRDFYIRAHGDSVFKPLKKIPSK